MRLLLLRLWALRSAFRDVILNFFKDVGVRFQAVLMIVKIALSCLARPGVFAYHVEVGLSGLCESVILLESVAFEAIGAPG